MLIENIASFIVYLIPFLLSIAGYYWIYTKAIKLEKDPLHYIIVFGIWGLGVLYTAWIFYKTVDEVFSDMNFNFTVIMVNCVIMTVDAIVIALFEKEK